MIIDDKGRLFGLINLLDLTLLIGAVILLYMGATVYVVFVQPEVTIQNMAPKKLMVGETHSIELTLINEKRLESATVQLIPKGFKGKVVKLAGRVDKRNRKWVGFTVPAAIQPGQYQLELEVVTTSIFNRKSVHKGIKEKEQLLTVQAKPPPPAPKVEERGKYFWPMELEVFFPAGQEPAAKGLRPGAVVAGFSGGLTARTLSVRQSNSRDTLSLQVKSWGATAVPYRGGKVARILANVDFVDLPAFQQQVLTPGAKLELSHGSRALTGYLLSMVAVEPQLPENLVRYQVCIAMLALNDVHRKALAPGAMQVDPVSGMVLAEVVRTIKVHDKSWVRVVAPTDQQKKSPTSRPNNSIVRMKLLCELKNGRVFYRGTPIKRDALLSFVLGGQTMVGTLQYVGYEYTTMQFNVLFNRVPRRVARQLRPGIPVYGSSTNELIGTIKQIIDSEPVELPTILSSGNTTNQDSKIERCLVRVELYCLLQEKGLFVDNQKVDFGKPLKVVLVSDVLEGVITIHDFLPPKGRRNWEAALPVHRNVLFPVVSRQVADNIQSGVLINNPGNGEPMGRILKTLEVEPVILPYNFEAVEGDNLVREYKRCLVRMELYCSTTGDGGIVSYGRKINYGSRFNTLIFGEPLEGYITILDSLPPPLKLSWHAIEVVFRNVRPAVSALIREGETEAVENEPLTMVIDQVLSRDSSGYLEISNDGRIIPGKDPLNQDIRCKLKILAARSGEKLIYKDNQLYIGSAISIETDRWRASGEILDY
jgi:Domain of unknown function (DUF4330)